MIPTRMGMLAHVYTQLCTLYPSILSYNLGITMLAYIFHDTSKYPIGKRKQPILALLCTISHKLVRMVREVV